MSLKSGQGGMGDGTSPTQLIGYVSKEKPVPKAPMGSVYGAGAGASRTAHPPNKDW